MKFKQRIWVRGIDLFGIDVDSRQDLVNNTIIFRSPIIYPNFLMSERQPSPPGLGCMVSVSFVAPLSSVPLFMPLLLSFYVLHIAQLVVQSHANSSCQSDGTLYYQCIYVPLAPPRTGEWSCSLSVLSQPLDITDHNRNSQLRNQIFKAGTNYTSPSLVSLFRKRRYGWCNATFWTSSSSTRHYGSWGVRYFCERKAVHFILYENRVNFAN